MPSKYLAVAFLSFFYVFLFFVIHGVIKALSHPKNRKVPKECEMWSNKFQSENTVALLASSCAAALCSPPSLTNNLKASREIQK